MTAVDRPPSVDRLARSLSSTGLPHALLVDVARTAIAEGEPATVTDRAHAAAEAMRRTLLTRVVNATGVLLHTNLGRAPLGDAQAGRAVTVEFDLATGQRGSRQTAVGSLFARLTGAEDAMVVNNNAAAVVLVLAALAEGRDVPVSRGESVEIGGSFRVPEVMEQSGSRLVDVGTTNRTRLADYERAIGRGDTDVALVMKVHPSNFRVEGFTEETSIAELATLTEQHGVPVVADIGSGLLDATCPWMHGPPPAWVDGEPAAAQAIADGASLITFSGDKLLGGPQAGIIAGRRELVEACKRHPLARALRPGGLVLESLQATALAYLDRRVVTDIPFWRMVAATIDDLRTRADAIVGGTDRSDLDVRVVDTDAVPGAGSAPGVTMPSVALSVAGDRLTALRNHPIPIVARASDDRTLLDLRSIDPADDAVVVEALRGLG
ncbi:MAG: L-seryl-tRNA(Sec) selenium transferase [Actinomycetota bacterium]